MGRHPRAGGKLAKMRRRKAMALKRPNEPKAVRRRSSFAAGPETKVALLARERDEALEQQAATADVLKVISRSTFDLQTVLDTLIASAVRLCEADMGAINHRHGDAYRVVAHFGFPSELAEFMRDRPIELGKGTMTGRVVMENRVIHVADVQADPDLKLLGAARFGGIDIDTSLGVPLLREGEPLGVMVLHNKMLRPFTDKQIELATTFADQAVIAIENARLLNELREALERQTATSDVLQILSSSPAELEPVFRAILESAVRICEARFGTLYLREGDGYRAAEMYNAPPS